MTIINISNVTDMVSFFALPNNASEGSFWFAVLIGIFIILLFMTTSYVGWETGFMVSSFASFILGVFLVYLHYVSWQYGAIFMGIILFIMLLIGFLSNRTAG